MALGYYEGSHEDDMMLLHWYLRMHEDGELERVLMPDVNSLSKFYSLFQLPTQLLLDIDEQGIVVAFWITPMLPTAAMLGLYVRPDKRHSAATYKSVLRMYAKAFDHVDVLFGVTKQEALLAAHEKLGYQVLTQLDKIWGGTEEGWLVMLRKEDFVGLTTVKERNERLVVGW